MMRALTMLAMTTAAASALPQSAPSAAAATAPPPAAVGAHDSLMAACTTKATGKTGNERDAFMSTCVADGRRQQEKRMRDCAAENNRKKVDAHRSAQQACLSRHQVTGRPGSSTAR